MARLVNITLGRVGGLTWGAEVDLDQQNPAPVIPDEPGDPAPESARARVIRAWYDNADARDYVLGVYLGGAEATRVAISPDGAGRRGSADRRLPGGQRVYVDQISARVLG